MGASLEQPLGGVRVDAALGELALDDLVHARACRLDEGRFVGDEAELHLLAHPLAAKPRVEHERHLMNGGDHRFAGARRTARVVANLARAPAQAREAFRNVVISAGPQMLAACSCRPGTACIHGTAPVAITRCS